MSYSGKRKHNPFVDVEAAVDREDEEELSDEEQFYIDDDALDERLEDTVASHSRLQRAFWEAEDEGGVNSGLEPEEEHIMEETQDLEALDAAAQAAFDRIDAQLDWISERVPLVVAESDRPLTSQTMFFEIRCSKNAHEEEIAFRILSAPVLIPNQPFTDLPRAVVARNDIPGRIFVEMTSLDAARRMAIAVSELRASSVRQISTDEMLEVLSVQKPPPADLPQWVRIRTPQRYRGDIALVVKNDSNNVDSATPTCYFVLVPRLASQLVTKSKRRVRAPPARLINLADLPSAVSINGARGNSYIYEGKTYSPQGYWIATYSDVEVAFNSFTMPTEEELRLFQDCDPELFPPRLRFETLTSISTARICEHNRVRIVHGDFAGLVGIVLQADDRELEVYINSQDRIATLARRDVRIHFLPGDEVHVTSTEYPDLTAWVLQATPGTVTVTNVHQNLEVTVSVKDVQFFSPSYAIALRVVRPPIPRWITVRKRVKISEIGFDGSEVQTVRTLRKTVDMKADPYKIYHGRRIMVGKGVYKGYKGYVKETMLNGRAIVELDAVVQNQKRVNLYIPHLVLLAPDDVTLREELTVGQDPRPHIPDHEPSASAAGATLPDPPAAPGATPMWTAEEQEAFQVPHSSDIPHWLSNPAFANLRIKLVRLGAAYDSMDFDGVLLDPSGAPSSEEVFVRGQGAQVRQIMKIADIRAQIPCMKGQEVVPTIGEHAAQVLRVFQYGTDKCILRPTGVWKKPKKGAAEIEYPTHTLAVVLRPH